MDNNTKQSDIPKTIAEAEQIAARYGITLTAQDYTDMYAVMAERQHQIERQDVVKVRKGWVDKFNRFYPKFLQTLLGIGDVLITMTQTVLIAFGIPLLLVMLLIVEQQRVDHGMSLFEVDSTLATFSATVLVLANLIFELLISWKENRAGYAEPPKHEFSFRLLAARLGYMFGRDSDWQPRRKSPAQRFKSVLRAITFTILVLALAGSMRSVIEQTQGNWSKAIEYVITDSTLLQAVTWLGGLLFAFAAVLSAQALSQYVAQKVIEIVAIMSSNAVDKPSAIMDAIGITGAAFLMGRIKETQKQRRFTALAHAQMMPNMEEIVILTETPETQDNETENESIIPDDVSDQMKQALLWLRDNPNHGLTHRKAAPLAGVSEATMYRAMQR